MTRFLTMRQAFGPVAVRPEVEAEHYARLRLANGTFKTTAARRLDDVTAALQPLLPQGRPLRCLDVAASSAVSSVEWLEAMETAGIEARVVATDLTMFAGRSRLGPFALLSELDAAGRPCHLLQVDLGPIALPNASGSRWRNTLFRLLRRVLPATAGETVALVGSAARARLAALSGLELARLDLLADPSADDPAVAAARPFDVIRAANILNHGYFPDAVLSAMIRGLGARLAEGGLLVVVRTLEDRCNHGGIYRRGSAQMRLVATIGSGSEVDALIRPR